MRPDYEPHVHRDIEAYRKALAFWQGRCRELEKKLAEIERIIKHRERKNE